MIILHKLLFGILIIGAKLIAAQSGICSSSYTALRFSQCLVEKVSESQFFTQYDRNSMTGVVDVLDKAIKSIEYGSLSVNILLTAFVTSLADVILVEDPSRNTFRKGVYALSLQQCSMSAVGYIDFEFIEECFKIVTSLEESGISKLPGRSSFEDISFSGEKVYNPEIHRQSSSIFNPHVVNPSSVQHSSIPMEPNGKTIINQPEKYSDFSPLPPIFPTSGNSRFPVKPESDISISDTSVGSQARSDSVHAPFKPQNPPIEFDYSYDEGFVPSSFEYGELNIPPSNQNSHISIPIPTETPISVLPQNQHVSQIAESFQHTIQPASNAGYPLVLDAPRMGRDPEKSTILESSDSTSLDGLSQMPFSNHGGLKVPQIKESSVIVIPPAIQDQNIESAPSQEQNLPHDFDTLYPTRTETSSQEEKSPIIMSSSASLPRTDKLDQEVENIPTLESVISNILINSPDFKNAFSSEMTKHNAIRLARVITVQSLSGYNSDIIREALNAVSEAVANVTVNSPENYALALANALVSVLKQQNLPLFVHGSNIATNIVFNLDTTTLESVENTDRQSNDDSVSDDVHLEVKEAYLIHKTEETRAEVFNKDLARYLSEFGEMENYFCSTDIPSNIMQVCFNIIKSSLQNLGEEIASNGARTTSKILSEWSNEYLCYNYGQVISTAITEILKENGRLDKANAEDIASRMRLSLTQQLDSSTQTERPKDAVFDMPIESTTNLPSKDIPILQPSFSSSFDTSYQETSPLPEFYYQSSTYSVSPFEDINPVTLEEYSEENHYYEPVSNVFSASPNIYEPSPTEEPGHRYEAINDYTSPLSSDVSQGEYPFSPTWLESLITLSEPFTEKAPVDRSDYIVPVISDDIIDQEALASYIFEEIESTLEALGSIYDNQKSTSHVQDHDSDSSETETEINATTDSPKVILQESGLNHTSVSVNHEEEISKKMEEKEAPSEPDGVTSDLPIQENIENENITTLSDRQSISRSSREHSESTVSNKETTTVSNYPSDAQFSPDIIPPNSSPSLDIIQSEEPTTRSYNPDFEDASFLLARAVSMVAEDSIAFIRSDHFDIWELCGKVNMLAPVLQLPPLDVCGEIPVIDYLLHVLRSVTSTLKGSK